MSSQPSRGGTATVAVCCVVFPRRTYHATLLWYCLVDCCLHSALTHFATSINMNEHRVARAGVNVRECPRSTTRTHPQLPGRRGTIHQLPRQVINLTRKAQTLKHGEQSALERARSKVPHAHSSDPHQPGQPDHATARDTVLDIPQSPPSTGIR